MDRGGIRGVSCVFIRNVGWIIKKSVVRVSAIKRSSRLSDVSTGFRNLALQSSGLAIHILHDDVVNFPEGSAVLQHFPRLVGV